MGTFYYDCPDHGNTVHADKPPRTIKCYWCGKTARRVREAPHKTVYVTPDVPEHFNIGLDMPVRSRRHLRDLQKRYGFQDYDKDSSKKSSNWIEKANFKDPAALRARAEMKWGTDDDVQR